MRKLVKPNNNKCFIVISSNPMNSILEHSALEISDMYLYWNGLSPQTTVKICIDQLKMIKVFLDHGEGWSLIKLNGIRFALKSSINHPDIVYNCN